LKRKIYYIVPLLLLLLGLLGPGVYLNMVNKDAGKDNTPPAVSFKETNDTAVSVNTPRETAVNANPGQAETTVQPSSENVKGMADAKPAGLEEGQAVTGLPQAPGKNPSSDTAGTASDSKEVTVKIAVLGKNEELLFGPASVTISKESTGGTTALDALDATGLQYYMSAKWPDFVESIAGQSNKGQSGWMFKVNEEIPLVSSADKPVSEGDKVIWWYSKSMDIPPPEWDNLLKR
jgi:hypothetical protein